MFENLGASCYFLRPMMSPVPRAQKRTEVQTFYHFLTLTDEQVTQVRQGLLNLAKETGTTGLIILGREGLNATASGDSEPLRAFVRGAGSLLEPGFEFLNVKTSFVEPGEKLPFLDFVVKVRKEIVTLGRPDILPYDPGSSKHLSPEEWHKRIQEPGALIIDTRNNYESAIGTFKNAVTPNIEEFSEFPEWLDQSGASKDQPAYIFCTGGIRCEKAIKAMEEKGFDKVYQLDGGILNYIDKFPVTTTEAPEGSMWDGECFVFDHRIAVDGDGRASQKFAACPHCGQPGDHQVFCVRCDSPAVVCDGCYEDLSIKEGCTCSKNCQYHWRLKPGVKGKAQSLEELKPRRSKAL